MYLTAQKTLPDEGGSAINAYLHLHAGRIEPDRVMSVLENVEATNGNLAFAQCDRRPGQAAVLAYLDAVADNAVERRDLEAAFATARNALANETRGVPFRLKVGPVAVEFGCTIGVRDGGTALAEFDVLSARALKLERERTPPPWLSRDPLDVYVNTEERGNDLADRYELSPDASRRVAHLQRAGWRATRFWTEHAVRQDFVGDHGDFLPVIVSALINLPEETVEAMGGVRIVEGGPGGRVLRTWPRRDDDDTLCRRLTGYPSVASMFEDVSGNYVPSIYPRDDEWRRLADAYDLEAQRRGDPRRAFRGPYR